MTPNEARLDLALLLAQWGEDVRLRRPSTGAEVTCRAFVRGITPSPLLGSGQTQQSQTVTIGAFEIEEDGWPMAEQSANDPSDPRIPLRGDQIITARGALTVLAASGVYVGGELVRINVDVRG